MSLSLRVILLSLVIAGSASGACARTQQAPAASAEKIQLIERYFEAAGLVATTDRVIDAMLNSASISTYSPAEAEALKTAMRAALEEARPWLMARFARVYAEAFTVEEIEALVAFYESPVGRSLTAKTVGLSDETARIMPEYYALVRRRLEANMCPGEFCPRPVTVHSEPPITPHSGN